MNQLFLLKLVLKMLEKEKPTPEQIACAREIVQSMVESYNQKEISDSLPSDTLLDEEANQARKELLG